MKKFILVLLILFSSSVLADCWYDGRNYPTGTVVDGLTCQADGSWK